MPKGKNSWDVVATVRADRAYVEYFVSAYRSLGASHIHLFFDDPSKSHILTGSNLTSIICDETYWAGSRPAGVEDRQTKNAAVAALNSSSDWILHCDIDEIIAAELPVAQALNQTPEQFGCLQVLPVEAIFSYRPTTVHDIFQTPWFKSMDAPRSELNRFWSRIYRENLELTSLGFLGHRSGKSFLRVALARGLERFPLHKPSRIERMRIGSATSRNLVLRHYDALLPNAWAEKHLDRASGRVLALNMGDKRLRLAKLIENRNEIEGMRGILELYDHFFVISERRLRKGEARFAIRQIDPTTTGLISPCI